MGCSLLPSLTTVFAMLGRRLLAVVVLSNSYSGDVIISNWLLFLRSPSDRYRNPLIFLLTSVRNTLSFLVLQAYARLKGNRAEYSELSELQSVAQVSSMVTCRVNENKKSKRS